ncbi:MAG TPA: SpoIIIAH-like family protein [Firmicutes bacterium]|jgi:stage III sporulation protein AH|nr:SpoIIIAH-like family protein [Bacillota bacterium]
MQDRARAGFALMVVIAVVLGVLIGTRNIGVKQDEGLFSVSKILDVSHDANSQGESASEMDFVDFGGEALGGGSDILDSLRLERNKTRSKNVESLETVARDSGLSEEARTAAGMQLLDLSKRTEREADAEALIKARGFKDALVFVRGDTCDVVIAGKELTKADAEQIGDIAARCLGVDLANITIIEQGDPR